MPRTPFNRLYRGIGNQLQQVARLHADILHPQVAGDLIGYLAKRLFEIRFQQSMPVSQHQVFKRT